jgi:hypothetical protein
MKSKRTKALEVSPSVKQIVLDRDGGRCIFCGTYNYLTYAHYINRGRGGLGVEQNIALVCLQHHFELDQSIKRNFYKDLFKAHLKKHYTNWDETELYYRKVK